MSHSRTVAMAAAVSVVVHVVLGTLLWKRPAEIVIEREPTNVEVIRLAGVIAPSRKPPVVVADPAPRPRTAARPSRAPETGQPGVSSLDFSRDERGSASASSPDSPSSDSSPSSDPSDSPSSDPSDAPAAPSAAPTLDTAALSRRLQAVALKCYPAAARRFRQTGEAQVRFCVDGAGGLRESAVTQTAGSSLLDHAASDCVIPGAAPFGPEAFDRCFTVPVRFAP